MQLVRPDKIALGDDVWELWCKGKIVAEGKTLRNAMSNWEWKDGVMVDDDEVLKLLSQYLSKVVTYGYINFDTPASYFYLLDGGWSE